MGNHLSYFHTNCRNIGTKGPNETCPRIAGFVQALKNTKSMDETTPIIDVMKHKRWQELSESLNALRTTENSDVTLTCAGKEFYVHKSVLEASSPYFVAMFHCGLDEAKSGKVQFQDMEPDALELILDYLYLGTVDKIRTIDQLKKVLESSHLMQLEHLVTYCYDALTKQLSLENFIDIWDIADKFDSKVMLTKVYNFLMVAVSEVLCSPCFTSLSFEQLKAFLNFSSDTVNVCDEFFIAIIAWLRKDLQERAKYAMELFSYVDAKSLSKTTVKRLLEDKELMSSCEEIRNGLKDISIAAAYFSPVSSSVAMKHESLIITKLGQVRLVFHSEYQLYLKSNRAPTFVELVNQVQEFDPSTMTWLPTVRLPSKMSNAITSKRNYITLQDDILRTISPSYVFNSVVLFLRNHMQDQFLQFLYLNRTQNAWEKIRPPNCVTSCRVVVSTSKYVYIVGTSEKSGDLAIEFNVLRYLTELDWNGVPLPYIPNDTKTHFFVYQDKLSGFYYSKGELVRIIFEHDSGKWLTKVLPIGPPGITDVSCIYRGSPDQCVVFVSTVDAVPQIPNFIWHPESGKWIRLPLPKGKCELEDTDQLSKLYRVCKQI